MMKSFITAWSLFVVQRRWIVLGITALLILFLIFPLVMSIVDSQPSTQEKKQNTVSDDFDLEGFTESNEDFETTPTKNSKKRKWLYFDNSNEMWFLPGDPAIVQYNQLKEYFGDNEYLLIGIKTRAQDNTLFNKETLQTIHKITVFLENLSDVTKVSSLTRYQYIHSANDTLKVDDLIEDVDTLNNDPQIYEKMENIMAKETTVHDFLITPDLKHTLISARINHKKGTVDHHVFVVNAIKDFIEKEGFEKLGFEFHFAGNPVISERFLFYSMKDTGALVPLMLLIIFLFLLFSFRSVSGVLMPFIVIIGSLFAVIAVLGYFGLAFNMLNVGILSLLIAVGIGDSVHILVHFYQSRSKGKDSKAAAILTTQELWLPCFYTSITTSIGFLAISITKLQPLREYGYEAAVGVFFAFLFSVTTLPALLSFVNKHSNTPQRLAKYGWIARITHVLPNVTFQYRKIILIISIIIAIFGIWGSSQIVVDSNFINYFKKESNIRTDLEYFDQTYRGGVNLEFIIDSGKSDLFDETGRKLQSGGLHNLEFLQRALDFQTYLESLDVTGKANSFLNYIQNINQSLNNDDPKEFRIPNVDKENPLLTQNLIAQYLFYYEQGDPLEDLRDLKTDDMRNMRISIRFKNMSTMEMKKLLNEIEEYSKKNFPDLTIKTTGTMVLFTNMDVYIQEGLVQSFSLAIILIILCFFVLFRSFKYGFLAMIPSIFPIIFTGGLMYLLKIDLNFGTMIVAAITFGIAVDDTIHVINRYIQARRNGKTKERAVYLAVTESGRAVCFTSMILFCGFIINVLASLKFNFYFGLLGGTIIIVALLADLIILPAALRFNDNKKTTF